VRRLRVFRETVLRRGRRNPIPHIPHGVNSTRLIQEIAALETRIAVLGNTDAEKKSPQDELKLKKAALKILAKELKDTAKDRLRIVKGQIKALEKLSVERDERIAEINRRADRETAKENAAIADLQRICSDKD
jgi:hypothetical protein